MYYLKQILKDLCKNRILLSAVSGLLMALPQVFPQLYFVAFFALIPLTIALLPMRRGRGGFKVMIIFALAYYLIAYSWFLYLHPLDWMGIEDGNSIVVVLFIWLVVCILHSLVAGFCGLLFARIKSKLISDIFLLAFILVIMEAFQALTAFALPWARLAITQHMFLPFLQSARLGGSLFVSFLIALINFLLGAGIISFIKYRSPNFFEYADKSRQNKKRDNKKQTAPLQDTDRQSAQSPDETHKKGHILGLLYISAAAMIFTLNIAYGLIVMAHQKKQDSNATLTVAAVQGNITPNEKWDDTNSATPLDRYLDLSLQAVEEGAKIILWPETTIVSDMYDGHPTDIQLKEFAKTNDVTLVVGSFVETDDVLTNSMFMYTPSTENAFETIYHKRHLVPFGEYLPYSEYFEWFFEKFPKLSLKGYREPGTEHKIFDSPQGKLSTIICFDSVFAKFTRQMVNGGAEILLLGTYDSYYKDSANPYQHSAHAVLRAVETDRYLLRASNSGVSSIIAPDGRYLDYLQLDKTGYVLAQIAPKSTRTLYSKTGDIIVYMGILYVVSSIALQYRKGIKCTQPVS